MLLLAKIKKTNVFRPFQCLATFSTPTQISADESIDYSLTQSLQLIKVHNLDTIVRYCIVSIYYHHCWKKASPRSAKTWTVRIHPPPTTFVKSEVYRVCYWLCCICAQWAIRALKIFSYSQNLLLLYSVFVSIEISE